MSDSLIVFVPAYTPHALAQHGPYVIAYPAAYRLPRWPRSFSVWLRRALLPGVLLLMGLLLTPARATASDTVTLYHMARDGSGDSAVQVIAALAMDRGGWSLAPGDEMRYDESLSWWVRGSVLAIDIPPVECADPRLAQRIAACALDLATDQDSIRFGLSMFADRAEDGSRLPRVVLDDVFSVYIEEVAHSWQEYFYETRENAARQPIHWETGARLLPAWEYQAKRYILSLDGRWLALSDAERVRLREAICADYGYANPTGYTVPAYGPPPGWPNPSGWPLTTPTAVELAAFCEGR